MKILKLLKNTVLFCFCFSKVLLSVFECKLGCIRHNYNLPDGLAVFDLDSPTDFSISGSQPAYICTLAVVLSCCFFLFSRRCMAWSSQNALHPCFHVCTYAKQHCMHVKGHVVHAGALWIKKIPHIHPLPLRISVVFMFRTGQTK